MINAAGACGPLRLGVNSLRWGDFDVTWCGLSIYSCIDRGIAGS